MIFDGVIADYLARSVATTQVIGFSQ